jgi:hypothetical protein
MPFAPNCDAAVRSLPEGDVTDVDMVPPPRVVVLPVLKADADASEIEHDVTLCV